MLTDSIGKISNGFERMKRDLPLVIGNEGSKFFRSSFEKQGFEDRTLQKWPEVQRRIPETPAYKYPKRNASTRHSRGILIGRSILRNAVNNSLKTFVWDNISWEVVIANGFNYSKVHNEGLQMKNGRPMPQRKFIGRSETFIRTIKGKIESALKKLHR